jgi:hypothetical protein
MTKHIRLFAAIWAMLLATAATTPSDAFPLALTSLSSVESSHLGKQQQIVAARPVQKINIICSEGEKPPNCDMRETQDQFSKRYNYKFDRNDLSAVGEIICPGSGSKIIKSIASVIGGKDRQFIIGVLHSFVYKFESLDDKYIERQIFIHKNREEAEKKTALRTEWFLPNGKYRNKNKSPKLCKFTTKVTTAEGQSALVEREINPELYIADGYNPTYGSTNPGRLDYNPIQISEGYDFFVGRLIVGDPKSRNERLFRKYVKPLKVPDLIYGRFTKSLVSTNSDLAFEEGTTVVKVGLTDSNWKIGSRLKAKGLEFVRSVVLCQLHIDIKRFDNGTHTSVTDCDAGPGDSGGPIFSTKRGDDYKAIAIHSGTFNEGDFESAAARSSGADKAKGNNAIMLDGEFLEIIHRVLAEEP